MTFVVAIGGCIGTTAFGSSFNLAGEDGRACKVVLAPCPRRTISLMMLSLTPFVFNAKIPPTPTSNLVGWVFIMLMTISSDMPAFTSCTIESLVNTSELMLFAVTIGGSGGMMSASEFLPTASLTLAKNPQIG